MRMMKVRVGGKDKERWGRMKMKRRVWMSEGTGRWEG